MASPPTTSPASLTTTPSSLTTTTPSVLTMLPSSTPPYSSSNIYIGVGLSVLGSVFLALQNTMHKMSILRVSSEKNFGHLCQWTWWLGTLSGVCVGGCDFSALLFAPAAVVSPLKILTVVFSALLSRVMLSEHLSRLLSLACLQCSCAVVIMVLNLPHNTEVQRIEELEEAVVSPGFLIFTVINILIICLLLSSPISRRFASRYIFVHAIPIAAILGFGLLPGVKGAGLLVASFFPPSPDATHHWLAYVCTLIALVNPLLALHFNTHHLRHYNPAVQCLSVLLCNMIWLLVAVAILFPAWVATISLVPGVTAAAALVVALTGITIITLYRPETQSDDKRNQEVLESIHQSNVDSDKSHVTETCGKWSTKSKNTHLDAKKYL